MINPGTSSIPVSSAAPDTSQFGNYSDWAQQEMAKGYSADQLQQTLSQHGVQIQQPQQQTAQPAQPASSGGSWWEKLLPAAGGVLGSLLSIPFGGVGGLAGASAGAALGQAFENAKEGKSAISGNDISSGIENGVGELVGLGAGKLVGALGEGLAGAGSRAIGKAADESKLATDEAKAATDQKATELNFGGISDPMQKTLKLGDSQDFVNSIGMNGTDPRDLQKASEAGMYLNNVYDRALMNSKPVDMSNAGKLFGATEETPATVLTPAEQQQAAKMGVTPEMLQKGTIQAGEGAPGGSTAASTYNVDRTTPAGQALAEFNKARGAEPNAALPAQMNATDVRKLQQAVGHQIGNLQKTVNAAQMSGKYDADLIGQLQDMNDLYGNLGAKIKTPEVNNSISNLQVTPADRQGLIEQYGDKLGNHIADTISNAKSADDLLGPMQGFKRMGDAADMALEDITQARATPRATARLKFQQNGGIMPSSQTSSTKALGDVVEAGAKMVHSPTGAVISAGRKLHEMGVTPKVAKGLGNVIKRTAPLLAPASVIQSNIPNIEAASQGSASAIPSNTGGTNMQPAASVNPANATFDSLLWSLSRPGASLTPGFSSAVGGASSLAPTVQNNELAANTVSALAPTFANAGGAQGLGGGLLSSLLSRVPGTAQNTYSNEQVAAAAQIAKLLGISPEAAMSMLPRFTQSQATAAPQIGATTGLVGNLTAGLPAQ